MNTAFSIGRRIKHSHIAPLFFGSKIQIRFGFSRSNTKYSVHDLSSSDPHKVLGVDKCASVDTIRESYLELCKVYHPDVGGSADSFKTINWAYEECKHQSFSKENLRKDTRDPTDFSGKSHNNSKNNNNTNKESDDAELREEFRVQFGAADDPRLIDMLLEESLLNGCFSKQDVAEPLLMAFQRYHLKIPFGVEHAEKCFEAMETWEKLTGRRVHALFFHTLLTMYSNQAFTHASDSMTVTETVNIIMDKMAQKGLPHDDWTVMIANRVFRTSPFPDWL